MVHTLYGLLRRLDDHRIAYRLDRHRPDTVMITITLVGERIEVDVFDDGHVEYSCFKGDESIDGEEADLVRLIERSCADD